MQEAFIKLATFHTGDFGQNGMGRSVTKIGHNVPFKKLSACVGIYDK